MNYRLAQISDAQKIQELTKECSVSRNSKIPGFVEFEVPSLEEYAQRIENNPYFLVAEEQKEVVGFAAGYSDERIFERIKRDDMIWHLTHKPRPFVYFEQLTVEHSFRRKGIGLELTAHIMFEMKKNQIYQIYGAISHFPVKNEPCIKLHKFLKIPCIEEITTREFLIFGIYGKRIGEK